MYNIIICDDDNTVLERYSLLIKQIASRHNTDIVIDTLTSGEQLYFQLEENPNAVDIIFLDILMGELNGIDAAKKLRDIGCDAQIIFLTTSEEYVFDAFSVRPLNYLIKDQATPQQIEDTFMKAVENASQNEQESYPITKGSNTLRVPFNQIDYFEVTNRTVTCHTREEAIDFYYKLDDIEKELSDKGFIRCHRSFIVNVRSIANLDNNNLTLKNGEQIPIAIRKYGEVKKTFSHYIRRHL